MSERESIHRQSSRQEQEQDDVVIAAPAKSSFDLTGLLDEIDSVLEENAEEFVKSFVQKGGQ